MRCTSTKGWSGQSITSWSTFRKRCECLVLFVASGACHSRPFCRCVCQPFTHLFSLFAESSCVVRITLLHWTSAHRHPRRRQPSLHLDPTTAFNTAVLVSSSTSPPPRLLSSTPLCSNCRARLLFNTPHRRRATAQLIKKIIHMSNYKSPAFQILHFWSMRSALLLVENSCIDILDDGLEYSSELHFDLSRERIAQSLLLTSVATSEVEQWQSVCATRNVRSFQRGSLEVRSNDWVVVNRNGQSCVGHVGEIIEFVATGGRFVRLLLRDARPIDPFNSMSGQVIRVSTSVAPMVHVVTVESSSFHEVYCDDGMDGELRFTYVY